jgi:hypothetical protein
MAGLTNRGAYNILGRSYVGQSIPTNYHILLFTGSTAGSGTDPTADTNTVGDHTQIATGNGYSDGGAQLTPGATDFDVHTEDDVNNRGYIQIKDIVFSASGGPIPASGDPAETAALTDDNGTVGSREVEWYWPLGSGYSVSDGQSLTLQDLEARIAA